MGTEGSEGLRAPGRRGRPLMHKMESEGHQMTKEPFLPHQRLIQGATGQMTRITWRFSAITVQKFCYRPTNTH